MIRMLSKISIAVLLASMMIADLSMVQASEVQAGNGLGGNFTLTDHDEQLFELSQLEGSVVLLFFGYTSCPDVCPAELGKMSQILRTFESRGDSVKGLFITVDPARDSRGCGQCGRAAAAPERVQWAEQREAGSGAAGVPGRRLACLNRMALT